MPTRVIHHRVEDVLWLLDLERSADEIAQRLSYRNVESLRRTMRKAGRIDLVDRLGPDTAIARGTRAGMRRARLETA